MNPKDISKAIKTGLQKGYNQNLLLLSSYDDFMNQVREYLLTVNVAQQLLNWNKNHQYKVRIEYPIQTFYTNAFPSHKWNGKDIFSLDIVSRDPNHSPTEHHYQKIDLAITQDTVGANATEDERSIVGIELKGINQSTDLIMKDVIRMANAMIRTDSISNNSIKYCYSGFLRRFDQGDQMVTDSFLKEKELGENKYWNNQCSILNNQFKELSFSFEFFPIVHRPVEVIRQVHTQIQSDYNEVANNTGMLSGGIITIKRN